MPGSGGKYARVSSSFSICDNIGHVRSLLEMSSPCRQTIAFLLFTYKPAISAVKLLGQEAAMPQRWSLFHHKKISFFNTQPGIHSVP
jgi:hypothetical protein